MSDQNPESGIVETPQGTPESTAVEMGNPPQPVSGTVEADVVQVNQSNVQQINAKTVEVHQGGVQRVQAEQVSVEQGGVGIVQSSTFTLTQGGVGLARTADLNIGEKGAAGTVIAQTATLNNTTTNILIANQVNGGPLRAFVVLANKIEGQVETMLDTRGALIAGLVAGIAAGMVMLVGRLITGRKS